MQFTLVEIPRLLPELLLLVLAVLVLGSDIFERWASNEEAQIERNRSAGSLTSIGLVLIFGIALLQSGYVYLLPADAPTNPLTNIVRNLQAGGPYAGELLGVPITPILGAFHSDHLTMIARLTFILAAFVTSTIAYETLKIRNPGEFYALLLASTVGMCLMAGATELILAFIAIELTSIPLYILAGYFRDDKRSSEAGMKYFLFGALSSCIMLYGMSLVFGFSANAGSNGPNSGFMTQFRSIAESTEVASNTTLLVVGMIFMIVGLGYKLAVVPFHAWAPDVYQGAPTVVTGFISTASKMAGFLLLLRLLEVAFPSLVGSVALSYSGLPAVEAPVGGWSALLALIALLTLVFGNLAALPQTNAKRLLSYSSIGQAGFILLGVFAWSAINPLDQAIANTSLIYYLVVYLISNIVAFAIICLVEQQSGSDEISAFNGLAQRNLPLAALMTISVLSLAGIPPLAGFFAKFYIFLAAWQAGAWPIVLAAVLVSFISLYYYLRFLKAMFIEAPEQSERLTVPGTALATIAVVSLLVLALGIYPNLLLELVNHTQVIASN